MSNEHPTTSPRSIKSVLLKYLLCIGFFLGLQAQATTIPVMIWNVDCEAWISNDTGPNWYAGFTEEEGGASGDVFFELAPETRTIRYFDIGSFDWMDIDEFNIGWILNLEPEQEQLYQYEVDWYICYGDIDSEGAYWMIKIRQTTN